MVKALEIILDIIFLLNSLFLVVVVLFQESKVNGLSGAIAGAGETYWGKNKARSREGALHKITIVSATLFIVLAIVLNII